MFWLWAMIQKHDEKGHHGGDGTGIRHFPGAAVVRLMPSFFLDSL